MPTTCARPARRELPRKPSPCLEYIGNGNGSGFDSRTHADQVD